MKIEFYNDELSERWDDFVDKCHYSTFQHRRKFLSYHQNKFIDRSTIVTDKGHIIGILPAVEDLQEPSLLVSHLGATYGGLLCNAKIYGETKIELIELIKRFYADNGYKNLLYKLTPSIYHKTCDEDDIYALYRTSSSLVRVDINAYIDKLNRLKVSTQRKRSYKSAIKRNLYIEHGFFCVKEFHSILTDNLLAKHGAKPVHSIGELIELKHRFDKEIELVVVKNESGEIISGVLFFIINNVRHAQYIASSSEGNLSGGLDYLFEEVIKLMPERYLSFGTSNENFGKTINQSLYRFKRQFGSGSISHLFFNIKLDK